MPPSQAQVGAAAAASSLHWLWFLMSVEEFHWFMGNETQFPLSQLVNSAVSETSGACPRGDPAGLGCHGRGCVAEQATPGSAIQTGRPPPPCLMLSRCDTPQLAHDLQGSWPQS